MAQTSVTFQQGPYTVSVHSGAGTALVVLIGEQQIGEELFRKLPEPRPSLAVVDGVDWDRELSPWPARRAFRGGADFAGAGPRFLRRLTEELLPEILTYLPTEPDWTALAGYSLAGLFAAWAMFQTDRFQRFAVLSGSLWYDEFLDYAEKTPPVGRPEKVYLSLGDGEKRTRNQRMGQVEENTRAFLTCLQERGVPAELHMEQGGHFNDVPGRLFRGIWGILGEGAE